MTLQRLLMILAAAASLSVLLGLLWGTRNNPADLNLHAARVELIRNADRAEHALRRQVERSRFDPGGQAQSLKEQNEALRDALARLNGKTPGLRGVAAQVDTALSGYARQLGEQLALMERYTPTLVRYGERLERLRADGETTLDALGPVSTDADRKLVIDLLTEAATYAIQPGRADGSRLDGLVIGLDRLRTHLPSSQATAGIAQLLAAVSLLRASSDELRDLDARLAGISTATSFAGLSNAYGSYFAKKSATANRYRRMLAIYALALLAAFAVIALRLRRSFADLDQVNGELVETNAHLEEMVEARTQQVRRAMDDLRLQQAHLIQSEKMASLGQMVAGVAHEINTPLGYALSNVETVRECLPALGVDGDAETREEVEALLADASHGMSQIGELVMNLKNFSRVDRSHTDAVSVHDGLESSLKICQNKLKDRVEIVRDYGELPPIRCAPSQINQVFLNLLTNAAQAMDGEGQIRIRTRPLGEQVEIAIRDSGCGMDEETQAHIFEPFFTTKPVGQGTGLGLSIVHRIVEDHGGSLRVQSRPGEGTEFTLVLPVRSVERRADGLPADAQPSFA